MYVLQKGETARQAAHKMLGNGMLYFQLTSPGWDGNPDNVQEGQQFFLDTEKHGPPARNLTDPKSWSRDGK